MPNYMLIYKGEATDMSEMTEEQGREVMAKWGEWMEKVGSAMRDVGAPFGDSSSLVDDGSDGTPAPLTGYSIVDADDMPGARALADGHPYLSDGRATSRSTSSNWSPSRSNSDQPACLSHRGVRRSRSMGYARSPGSVTHEPLPRRRQPDTGR